MVKLLRIVGLSVLGMALAGGLTTGQAPSRTHLVIVVDGLRPDYVTPALMPRLSRLGGRGVVFRAHHSVFPTVTRVNAASFVTGAYPERHGLMGNTIYLPAVDPLKGLDTGDRATMERAASVEGRLLTAPTLDEMLTAANKRLLVASSGSSGSAFILDPIVGRGSTIHPEFTRPSSLTQRVRAVLGTAPEKTLPNDGQNQFAVDGYLTLGLDELRPDVTMMWISDPDSTAHANGIGTETSQRSLSLVDAAIGRIEDTLKRRGLLEHTNILVTSDHGFSTHTGELRLAKLVEPFAMKMPDGTSDIAVAEGAIYLRSATDRDARVAALVAALQQRPEVGAVFTAAAVSGQADGRVPGTLSFDLVHVGHPRAGQILVSANWTDRANAAGFRGTTAQTGTAGHGTSSPFDIHNTLIAAGPDFREGVTSDVPTGNVDVMPTLLHLLGMPVPPSVQGRVLTEGLQGATPSEPAVQHREVRAETADGRYRATAFLSAVNGHEYLDRTEVVRR